MKNQMKRELINDIVTGLLVAAVLAAVIPGDSLAQDLISASTNSKTNVFGPFVTILSYASYVIGAVVGIAGIAGVKKHADTPGTNPLGPALGKLGAGAAFIAAPAVIGMLQGTANGTLGNGNGTLNTIGGF